MKVYAETLAKADRWSAVDKVSYPGRKNSGNRDIRSRRISFQASLLLRLLECLDFDGSRSLSMLDNVGNKVADGIFYLTLVPFANLTL